MSQKNYFWHNLLGILLIIALTLPVLTACDDDDDDETTTSSTTAAQGTINPTSTEPVKIGWVTDYTGPYAMVGPMQDRMFKVVEQQVKEMGGILGGRLIEVVTFDGKTQVSLSQSGVDKLIQVEKVSAIASPGLDANTSFAGMEKAVENGYYACLVAPHPADLTDYPGVIRMAPPWYRTAELAAEFIVDELQPGTVAFITDTTEQNRNKVSDIKGFLDDAGIETVQEQYVDLTTTDMSPYATKIKYEEPDLLIAILDNPGLCLNLYKAMEGIGGWGSVKTFNASEGSYAIWNNPIGEGAYVQSLWVPSIQTPGNQKMMQDAKRINNFTPGVAEWYVYMQLWATINAIELAGTDDPQAIAEAARSGQLRWDDGSPQGPITWGMDGEVSYDKIMCIVKDGHITPLSDLQ